MSFRIGSREREFAMPGGVAHRGQVVRVGDTVRRPQNPGSRAIHALLEYLHDVGFDGAPRYLGDDEHGREVLSYVQGEVPRTPFRACPCDHRGLGRQKWLVRGLSLGAVK